MVAACWFLLAWRLVAASQTHPLSRFLPRYLAPTICIAFSKIYHPLDLHTREILAIVVAAVAVDGEITAKFGDGVSTYRVGLKVEAGS